MKSQEYFKQKELYNSQQSEKNEQELLEAAKSFTELTQKVFRENSDEVTKFKLGDTVQLNVLLKKHVIDAGNYLTVSVEKKLNKKINPESPFKPSEIIIEDITVQQMENNRGRELLSYRLNADGIVRRWDGGDIYAKAEAERAHRPEENRYSDQTDPPVRDLKMAQKELDDLMNVDLPIARIEESLGYQNQPVGLDEITRLRSLIDEE